MLASVLFARQKAVIPMHTVRSKEYPLTSGYD